ncbi:unnamed protein product [Moneuplotes crassus]|uniref:Uncharacterized protein n=1 Tax=Euplotes crassus TaxID=5936 RepID=A0AAD2DBI1_EUPCR|nr:unnamed protein product [Moneuplotes crassus]
MLPHLSTFYRILPITMMTFISDAGFFLCRKCSLHFSYYILNYNVMMIRLDFIYYLRDISTA